MSRPVNAIGTVMSCTVGGIAFVATVDDAP